MEHIKGASALAYVLEKRSNLPRDKFYKIYKSLDEYRAYTRYAIMFEYGRENARYLYSEPLGKTGVRPALDTWDKHAPQQTGQSGDATQTMDDTNVSAILFTDIVNFTASHQKNGDNWMKDVLRAHNEIIREAIQVFNGTEVKHTGDGIMASFPTPRIGLHAAAAMQRAFNQYNKTNPHRNFGVRVGIAAGEPVHMEGDLFGTPVNMAARVMPFAGAHEIVCSENMPAYIGLEEGFQFTEIPDCVLKGFDGKHTIHRFIWEKVDEDAHQKAKEDAHQSTTAQDMAKQEIVPETDDTETQDDEQPTNEAPATPTQ